MIFLYFRKRVFFPVNVPLFDYTKVAICNSKSCIKLNKNKVVKISFKLTYFFSCFVFFKKQYYFYKFLFQRFHLSFISYFLKYIIFKSYYFFKFYLKNNVNFIKKIILVLFSRKIFAKIFGFNLKFCVLKFRNLMFKKRIKNIRFRFRIKKKFRYYSFSKYQVILIRKYLRFSRKKRNIGRRFICYSNASRFIRKRRRRLYRLKKFNYIFMKKTIQLLLLKSVLKKNVDG